MRRFPSIWLLLILLMFIRINFSKIEKENRCWCCWWWEDRFWDLFVWSLEAVRPVAVRRIEETTFLLEITWPRVAKGGIIQTSTKQSLIQCMISRSCTRRLFTGQSVVIGGVIQITLNKIGTARRSKESYKGQRHLRVENCVQRKSEEREPKDRQWVADEMHTCLVELNRWEIGWSMLLECECLNEIIPAQRWQCLSLFLSPYFPSYLREQGGCSSAACFSNLFAEKKQCVRRASKRERERGREKRGENLL